MKNVKERLARRANRDDGCTGHFCEGRFQSVRLVDQAAVIAAMVHVDPHPMCAAQWIIDTTAGRYRDATPPSEPDAA